MRDVLEALDDGEIDVSTAEAELAGYATVDAGRFDAAREQRRGVPEAVLADGKTPDEIAELVSTAVETTGRGIATRIDQEAIERTRSWLSDHHPDAELRIDERSDVLVAHADGFEPPSLDARVVIVAAGTADSGPAGEAAAIVREMGADVERIDDVGVANLTRLTDQVDRIRAADVVIVAAGREGSLPTVVAGLVNTPVIALPVASGYGYAGDGEAALVSALQSCTVLTTVNVDAGFVAGAQAGLIAQAVSDARTAATDK